ncbi:MAG: serine kinase [Firmicutes bacterium]|nr:serine kinase [Bacillota bacterium]
MELSKVVDELNLEVIAGYNDGKKEVNGAYIGDLLSLVMSKAESNNLWLTIQTHLNVIAVATLVDVSAIIVVENMEIDEDTIKKADSVKVPLLKTKLSAYELASKLAKLGV